ncbi:MAG: hypothetical protein Q9216_000626 [Gyalolechia sp. 2 TL-2023]
MDSVQETPAKRRKINAGPITSSNGFDFADHGGDILFNDYETVDTVPLPRIPPDQQPSSDLAPLSPLQQATQPTQILNLSTPISNHNSRPSVVQVAASSPLSEPIVPSSSPVMQRLGASLANRMAPPGTAFRSPIGIQKPNPIVDLSSDDDDCPRYRGSSSDEESQISRKADIKPSKFISSAQNDVRSGITNRFKEITSKSFYKPLENGNADPTPLSSLSGPLSDLAGHQASTDIATTIKRSADVMANTYGGASRPMKARRLDSTTALRHQDITLDDIQDYQVRTKVGRMHNILPTTTIVACKAALIHKKGNFDDAMDYLSALEGDQAIDLTKSDNDTPSQQPVDPIKPTAKQQLKAPAKSIQSKWTATQAFTQQPQLPSSSSPKAVVPKPRRRLVQGRRNLRTAGVSITRKPSPAVPEGSEPVDAEIQSDSAIGSGPDDDELERKVLGFLNSCTSDQLSDIAAVTEKVASLILSKRPFKNLGVVRIVSGDAKANKERTVRRPVGDRVVDTCLAMWKGYEAVDGLVRQCEFAGRPVADQIKKWGFDIYSASNDGELDLINFDHKSEPETSLRDSGIGTPTSGVASADEDSEARGVPQSNRNAIFSQPRLLHKDVVLKDYQLVGVNWLALLFEKELSCILADDMGLGKTCQVIAFLAHLFEKGSKGPHLVIVPGSTIENWLREFSVFCPKLTVMPYYAGQAERINIQHQIEENLDDINVIVTTYGIAKARDDCRFLRRLPLQVCVYDEGHILKNRKSAAYEQLTRFGGAFRLLLTGTPLQNNLSELVSLLAFIMPQIFKEHSENLDMIFSQKAKTTNEGNAALLSTQRISRARSMMAPFVLRRKKHQVLKHLPPKTRRVEWCELSPNQAKVYNSERARGLKVIADRAAGKKVGNETANVMMSLRKASIHPLLFRRVYDDKVLAKMARDCLGEEEFKNSQYELCLEDMSVMMDFELQRFCERYSATMSKYRLKNDEWMDSGKVTKLAGLLTGFKDNRDRVLVFSQFVMVMDILEDVMETLGMRFFRLDGRTKIDERQDMIDQFYADEEITVFLLSTKAGGAGINLACANKVVIFDSSFNPQDDIQAENRAHRVGQTKEVEVIRLVTKGTIEEQIHALGQTKLALDDRVAGAGEANIMTTEDEKQAERQGQRAVEEIMIEQMEAEQSGKRHC